jgi:hypothetical protein
MRNFLWGRMGRTRRDASGGGRECWGVGDDVKWRVRDGGDGGKREERVVAWRWASGQRVWVWY